MYAILSCNCLITLYNGVLGLVGVVSTAEEFVPFVGKHSKIDPNNPDFELVQYTQPHDMERVLADLEYFYYSEGKKVSVVEVQGKNFTTLVYVLVKFDE